MFIDASGRRVDPSAPFTDDEGIRHPNRLFDLERFGITEITPPQPPADFTDVKYEVIASEYPPYLSYVPRSNGEVARLHNADVDSQIDALEREQILPRITRDMHRMVTLQAAAAQGITEANLLDENHPAYSPGYKRFYDFDAQIAALRAQRV